MSDDEGASGNERLLAACREDNLELLEEVLSSDPNSFNINHTDGLGNSALHYAARYASTDCLEVVLYFDGLDINIKNRLEWETPLHKAVVYEDPEVALTMTRLLVDAGASITVLNKQKQTPADKAPNDTHGEVKEYLESVRIGSNYDARDIPAEYDDDSDGVASDDD